MDGTAATPAHVAGTLEDDARFARLAAAAYKAAAVMGCAAADEGYPNCEAFTDDATGADCFLVWNEAEAVIVFRGTQRDFRDILTDLKIRREDLRGEHGLAVHRGFYAQYLALHHQLREWLADGTLPRVVAVGHSLGGALAVFAAYNGLAHEAVTFGAPRVGDAAFAEACDDRGFPHRRYVLGADIVPWLPLLVLGYRHDVAATYITADRRRVIRAAPLWRQLVGVAYAALTLRWESGWTLCPVPRRLYTDHRINGYAATLWAHAEMLEEAPS